MIPSERSIIDSLKVNYNIEVEWITPLSGGADMNAAVCQVQAFDQSSYFVKLKHGDANDINIKILELLQNSGVQQIIPPIKTIRNRSIVSLGDFCLTIYPFIEGVDGFSRKLTENQWMMLGKALRKVHDFDVPYSLLKHIRHEAYSPNWRQTVRALYAKIHDEPAGHDAIALKFLNFIKEHRSVIERLVERAEQLSDTIKDQSAKFVLCHSDIHAGNILIKGSGTIYIVDWDDPIMAPKERDLMFIGGGVANVWNDPKEEICFYQGYGKTDINRSILAYYRHERIVQDIAEYAQALLSTSQCKSHANRSEMYKHFISMFDPQGVVDIAFKTDEATTR